MFPFLFGPNEQIVAQLLGTSGIANRSTVFFPNTHHLCKAGKIFGAFVWLQQSHTSNIQSRVERKGFSENAFRLLPKAPPLKTLYIYQIYLIPK